MSRPMVPVSIFVAGLFGAGLVFAETYPHAFPRSGTRKLFSNERVDIWDVVWKIGVAQPLHRHRYDMAGVYLQYGQIRVTRPDGTVNPSSGRFEIPRLLFQPKDVTHKEEGIGQPGDPERMAIMTDLKGYSPAYPPPSPGTSPAFPRQGAKKEIDNDRVTFWDYTWQPNTLVPLHFHDKDAVEVFVEGGTMVSKRRT